MFANGLGERGSISGRVLPKIKNVEQSKELRRPLHLGVVAIEKEAFRSLSAIVANLFYK